MIKYLVNLHGIPSYSFEEKEIIKASIKFIQSPERVAGSLLWLTTSSEPYF